MKSYSVRYQFSQPFAVPARRAYEWCTDYRTDDLGRMGMKGRRKIRRINADTLILTDTVVGGGRSVRKEKLVRLDPARMYWTNTYLAGPYRHSQFLYEIVSEGKDRSRLDFTGLQVFYGEEPSAEKTAEMARKLAKEDSGSWSLLAEAMRRDLD